MKNRKLFIKITAVIMAGVFLSTQALPAFAANSSFTQSDWSYGQSTGLATHSSNRDGLGNPWKKYNGTDKHVYTTDPGAISLSPVSSALYGNAQEPYAPKPITDDAYSDFIKTPAAAIRNINIIDNSGDGTLQLNPSTGDPFYTTLGHWEALPQNPHSVALGSYVSSAFTIVKNNPAAGDYYVYTLWSGASNQTKFARWNVNTERWEFLGNFEVMDGANLRQISIAGGSDGGSSLAYPGAGGYIYALRGGGTKEFYRYQISTGLWTRLPDFPNNVSSGGGIVATDYSPNLRIFGTGGSSQTQVHMYNGTSWTLIATLPFGVYNGGGMVYPGGDSVYVFQGNSGYAWIKFNKTGYGTSGGSPTPPPTYRFTYGTSKSYPGSGGYIYFATRPYSGDWPSSGEFMRLNVNNNEWEYSPRNAIFPKQTLTRMPFPAIGGAGFFYYKDGVNPKICWLKPDSRLTRPFVYDLNTNKWEETSSNITYFQRDTVGSAMVWDGGSYLYHIGSYGKFTVYSMTNNQWEDLSLPALQSNTSGSGCEFLPLYIPLVSGDQYPFRAEYSYGGSMAYCDGYIYIMAGQYRQAFIRYNISTKAWQAIATPPRPVYSGGSIAAATDPISAKKYIYAFAGNSTYEFWRYEIPASDTAIGSWEQFNRSSSLWQPATGSSVIGTPSSVFTGGCLIYPGAGDYLYATLSGVNNGRGFYRFSLSTNAWEALDSIPSDASLYGIANQSLLVYSPSEHSIYFLEQDSNSPFAMAKYPLGNVANPDPPATTKWQILDDRKHFLGFQSCVHATDPNTGRQCLYAFSSWSSGIFRYDIGVGWDPPQSEYGGADYGQAVLGPDNDTVYYITGNPSSRAIIWKYSISQKKWLDYIAADPRFIPYVGTVACYPGADGAGNSGNIYILEGGYGPRLWRMNITNGTFERLEDCVIGGKPVNFLWGTQLVGSGNDLYAIQSWDTHVYNRKFYRYKIYAPAGDPEPQGWYQSQDIPADGGGFNTNKSLIRFSGKIYWVNPSDRRVYEYGGSWSLSGSFPQFQGTFSEAILACGANVGGADYLFLASKTGFYKCSSGGQWQQLTSVPLLNTYGCSLIYPGTGDFIYAVPGGGRTDLMCYSISQDVWNNPPLQQDFTYYPSLTALGDGDSIYYRPGYYLSWYRYSASNKVWIKALSDIPENTTAGSRMTGTGNAVYALSGKGRKTFYKYDTVSWTNLADLPEVAGDGGSLCYKGDRIYATKGGNTNLVWRYSLSNIWETVSGAGLGSVGSGGGLCSGDGKYIYCLRGNGTPEFYRYDTSSGLAGTWQQLTSMPATTGWGSYGDSAICYPGFGNNIYVMPSSTLWTLEGMSKLFYRYSISEPDPALRWKELEPPPAPVTQDCELVYPGSGSYLYATAGFQQTTLFWRYLAFIEGEYVSDVKYAGNNAGFDTASWNTNGSGSIEVRMRTSDSPAMNGAPKWGDCPKLTSGNSIGGGMISSVTDGHRYIQYQIKMTTDNENFIPELYSMRIDYKIYPNKQELVSSAYDSEAANNRIMNLSWTKLPPPPGADIRFQLSTSPDGITWSDWYGPGPGDTQDFIDTYSAANQGNFSYQQAGGPVVIEIINDGVDEGARLKKLYPDFAHTQEIVLDNTGGLSSAGLVMVIEISSSNIDFWDNVIGNNGEDVRFADADGNLLTYNIKAFDRVNKYAKFLVRIPSVPADSKTAIYLKYGMQNAGPGPIDTNMASYPSGGLIGCWNFDEGKDLTVNDNFSGTHNGSLSGGASWVSDGKFGNALRLGTGTSKVTINNPSDFKINDYTIGFYIRFNGLVGAYGEVLHDMGVSDRNPGIWLSPNQYSFHWKQDPNNLGTNAFGPTGEGSQFTPARWYHVAGVKDGAQFKMYIDGIKIGNPITVSNQISPGGNSVVLGSIAGSSANIDIDNLFFYNRALTDNEISAIKNGYMTIPYYFYTVSESNICGTLGQDWPRRLAVSIDNRSGTELTNYQIQVNLTKSQEDFWKSCRPDGYDIRFIDFDGDPNGSMLTYWRGPPGAFDPASKSASLWVKVPVIPAGQVKTIYLYYGYKGSAPLTDVSTFTGAMTKTYFNPSAPLSRDYPESGPNVSALQFDGTGYVNIPNSALLTPATGKITLEALVNYKLQSWLPGFAYRRMITLDNTGHQANFVTGVVKFTLPVANFGGHANIDYSDLRFCDMTSGDKLRYRILSSDASNVTVLVLFPAILPGSIKDIYVYYGNAQASSESDNTLIETTIFSYPDYTSWTDNLGTPPKTWSFSYNGIFHGMMGGLNSFSSGGAWIKYTVPNLPAGTYQITFDYYFIDSWDNEEAQLWANTTKVWYLVHNNSNTAGNPLELLHGVGAFIWCQSYRLIKTVDVNHTGGDLILKFTSTLNGKPKDDESFGVDNVRLVSSLNPISYTSSNEEPQGSINQIIAEKSGSYGLKFNGSGLTATVGAASVSTTGYDTGRFMNAAVAYDGSNIKLLVDGVEKASAPFSGAIPPNNNGLVIGSGLKGAIDEVRLWNKPRSAGEIRTDRFRNIPGSAAELTSMGMSLYLKLNENGGPSCGDSAGSNTGAVSGSGASWLPRPFAYTNEKPAALYHFEVMTTDSSGNGNTITNTGILQNSFDLMSQIVNPEVFSGGKSPNFTGAAATYMTVADSPSLGITKGLSIECWVRPQTPNIAYPQVIIAKGDDSAVPKTCNYMLYCSGGEIGLSYIDSTGAQRTYQTVGANFTQYPTAHVVAIVDESARMVYIYVNGAAKYSGQEAGGNLSANAAPLYIGKSAASVVSPAGSQTTYYAGGLDELRVYNRVLPVQEILAHYGYYAYSDAMPANFYYFDPAILNPDLGAYPTNNPTIQPNMGVFYDATSNIVANGFTDSTVKPAGTEIKYQISNDGYSWYWFGTDTLDLVDGAASKWRKAYGAYTSGQVNTDQEISGNIASFQTQIAIKGELYYRAYLHTESGAFDTPILKSVSLRLNTGVHTFYTDQTAAGLINTNHTDAVGDRYFRYKTILYSSGQNTPQLEDVTVEYINASVSVSSPVTGTYGLGQNLPITYLAQAIPSGKVTIKYNTYNASDVLIYTGIIAAGASATDGSHTINWLLNAANKNLVAPKCRVEIVSEDIHKAVNSLSPVFTTAALNVTAPAAGNIWEIGTAADPRPHTIRWNNFGLTTVNGDLLTIQYSLDGNTWATSDNINTGGAPETQLFNWDNRYNGLNITSTNNAVIRIFKPALPQDPGTPGNLIGMSAPFALVPIPTMTIQPFAKPIYKAGAPVTIDWQTNQRQFSSTVDIDYSMDGFITTHPIAVGVNIGTSAGTPNSPITGSYSWTPQQQDIFDGITIRVKEQGYPPLRDTKQSIEGISAQTISIKSPTITISAPAITDRWVLGDTQIITWTTDGSVSDTLFLEYSKDGVTWDPLLPGASTVPNNVSQTDNGYSWAIQGPASGPGLTGGKVQLRLTDINKSTIIGISPQFEVLSNAVIEIAQPNGGENIILGTPYPVKWNTWGNVLAPGGADYLAGIDIFYKIKDGDDLIAGNWLRIANQIPNTGQFQWLVDSAVYSETTLGKIKIVDHNDPSIYSISASTFSITHPEVGFDSPANGDSWLAGGLYDLMWNTKGAIGNLAIEYYVDGVSALWTPVTFQSGIIETSSPSDPIRHFYGKWRIPKYPGRTVQIRLTDTMRPVVTAAVIINLQNPTINITSPTTANATGANSWALGTAHSITWTTTGGAIGALSGFKVLFSKTGAFDGNSPVLATITDPPSVNTDTERSISFPWGVLTSLGVDPVSATAHIKIFDTGDNTISKTSDTFTISPPSVNIEAPVSVSDIYMGQQYLITWYVVGNITGAYPLTITYDRDVNDGVPPAEITPAGFMSDNPLIQDLGNGRKGYLWTVPSLQADYPDYTPGASQVTVTGTYPSLQAGVSEQFAIKYPQLTVVNPGAMVSATDTVSVAWASNGKGTLTGPFLVEWAVKNDFINANIIYPDPNIPAEPYWPSGTSQISWLVPQEAVSANVWLRVRDMGWASGQIYKVQGMSASSFAVLPEPSVTVTSPDASVSGPDNAWRLGNTTTISWVKNNSGAMSNNIGSLSFYYALDALGGTAPENWTWVQFAPTDYAYNEITGARSVKWAIPVTMAASTTCAVKMYDNTPWRNVPEKHLTVISDRFEIAIPRIVISAPKIGECWAYGEIPTILWHSDGAIDDNSLSIFFTSNADQGSPSYDPISALNQPNNGTFTWSTGVPAGTRTAQGSPNGQIMIKAKYAGTKNITVYSETFKIISAPTITVTDPGSAPGQEYEVGKDMVINWSSQGISVGNVKIEISPDNFANPANTKTIADSVTNTPNVGGQYIWTIPGNSLVGNNINIRISKVGDLGIQGLSQNVFRIKGGFNIASPNGGESWIAKSPQTITWVPYGDIAKVQLQLSWDSGVTWDPPFAIDVDNTGSYSCVLPDIPPAQPKVMGNVRIRICNQLDNTEFDTSDADFTIRYATVTFTVRDFDSGQHLQDIMVQKENGTDWFDSALVSPIIRENTYPYGTYTTFFAKTDYMDNSVTWATPKQQNAGDTWIISVSLENKALAQVTFESILTYSYSPSTDILNAVGSLQRKGKLVGITEDDRNKLGNATLTIYEPNSDTIKYNLTSSPPADKTNWNGMYYFTINAPTGFVGGQVYPAKLTTEYGIETAGGVPTPRIYPSTANIEIGMQAQLGALQGTAGMIEQAVRQTIPDKIDAARSSIEEKVDTSTAAIKDETSKILTATGTEPLQNKLNEAKTELANIVKSEILNRENSIKAGQKLTIRYRTPGTGAVIDVYDPANLQKVVKQVMTVVPAEPGLYYYDLVTDAGWAKGDYTVMCSDTNGNMDAMILSVITSNLEDVYGSVMSILGTTQSLNSMKDIAESMNSQFSVIETALNKASKDMVGGMGNAAATSQALDSVFNQLVGMSKQMKDITGSGGINLEKLYKVSADKKSDMTYLKNKTQQLRAAMEISKKMVDNIANKPVTQTWYEYK